jgi:hypothetical protein
MCNGRRAYYRNGGWLLEGCCIFDRVVKDVKKPKLIFDSLKS